MAIKKLFIGVESAYLPQKSTSTILARDQTSTYNSMGYNCLGHEAIPGCFARRGVSGCTTFL